MVLCGVLRWRDEESGETTFVSRDCPYFRVVTHSTQMLILLLMLFSAAIAQQVSSDGAGHRATFKASDGDTIKLDTQAGTLDAPRARGTGLKDCSDKVQVCLTDDHGFAFAYFRKCKDAAFGDYTRLRFRPKIVSVLHNSDVWLVFDAAPNYMFHYDNSKGIVGIYLGPTASFDFTSVFHDRSFRMSTLAEYRITSSDAVAACSE